MDKLSESYVAFTLEKNFLHPIPQGDLKQVLKDLMYAFVGIGKSSSRHFGRTKCSKLREPSSVSCSKLLPDGLE